MIPVSDQTRRRVESLFHENEWQRVLDHLLRECSDNLPLVDTSYEQLAERIRFAVLKLSNGNFQKLREQTREAGMDWRDVLMAAGFGEDTEAHLAWHPQPTQR